MIVNMCILREKIKVFYISGIIGFRDEIRKRLEGKMKDWEVCILYCGRSKENYWL